MQTKNIVIISRLIITSLLFGLFWVIAPAHMKDKVIGLITYASTDRQCFNYYKNKKDYFKDPDSAYMESSLIWTKKDNAAELSQYPVVLENAKYDSIVRVKVRAKNSMGDYVSDNIECPLVNNKFDEFEQTAYSLQVIIHDSDVSLRATCAQDETAKHKKHKEMCSKRYPDGL